MTANEYDMKFEQGDIIQSGIMGDYEIVPFEVLEVDEDRGYLLIPRTEQHTDMEFPAWFPRGPYVEAEYVKVGTTILEEDD